MKIKHKTKAWAKQRTARGLFTPNAETLRYLRERMMMSQQEVADAIMAAPSNLSRWETGRTRMRDKAIIRKLAKLYGVQPAWLGKAVLEIEELERMAAAV